ncbi:MAG TPA: hypothetical protein VGJ20_15885, partial [Xanthobacteraceae bacterium]
APGSHAAASRCCWRCGVGSKYRKVRAANLDPDEVFLVRYQHRQTTLQRSGGISRSQCVGMLADEVTNLPSLSHAGVLLGGDTARPSPMMIW